MHFRTILYNLALKVPSQHQSPSDLNNQRKLSSAQPWISSPHSCELVPKASTLEKRVPTDNGKKAIMSMDPSHSFGTHLTILFSFFLFPRSAGLVWSGHGTIVTSGRFLHTHITSDHNWRRATTLCCFFFFPGSSLRTVIKRQIFLSSKPIFELSIEYEHY